MRVAFADVGWEDYLFWQETDGTVLRRLNTLIAQCRRTPFDGIGKPEPLKRNMSGWWSRRLTQEDRLIYRVTGAPADQTLEILQCRLHY